MPVEIRPLFRPDAIRPLLTAFQLPPRVETCRAKLNHWRELLESDRANRLNERELLPEFLSDIFGELLGYAGPASGGDHYTMSREAHVAVDGKYADAVLGHFSAERKRFVIAVEGKSAKDPPGPAVCRAEEIGRRSGAWLRRQSPLRLVHRHIDAADPALPQGIGPIDV